MKGKLTMREKLGLLLAAAIVAALLCVAAVTGRQSAPAETSAPEISVDTVSVSPPNKAPKKSRTRKNLSSPKTQPTQRNHRDEHF